MTAKPNDARSAYDCKANDSEANDKILKIENDLLLNHHLNKVII